MSAYSGARTATGVPIAESSASSGDGTFALTLSGLSAPCTTVSLDPAATWIASAHGIADVNGYVFTQLTGEGDTLEIDRKSGNNWVSTGGSLQLTPFTAVGSSDLRILNQADAATFEYCPP